MPIRSLDTGLQTRLQALLFASLLCALAAESVQAISAGGVHLPSYTNFCGELSVVVQVTVCNTSEDEVSYTLQFVDHGEFLGCDQSVLPAHSNPPPIALAAGQCGAFSVEIWRPAELDIHLQVCYWVQVQASTGGWVALGGLLRDSSLLCFEWDAIEAVRFLHPMDPVTLRVNVTNHGTQPHRFVHLFEIRSGDGSPDGSTVSLNGRPPGDVVFGDQWVGEGETIQLSIVAEWLDPTSADYVDLVLRAEDTLQELASLGLHRWVDVPVAVPAGARPPAPIASLAPNPAVGSTVVSFVLSEVGSTSVRIYDAAGRLVQTLVSLTELPVGRHAFTWDGRARSGAEVPSGVYWVRVQSGDNESAARLVLRP
jgi:hypothetical protein